jgi:hypothetical protein
MAPATCLSQVLVFAMFAPFAHVSQMGGTNLGYLALLGIVQMGMALFFLSLGARLVPAADAALISQLENVLGPLWVWLAGIEYPSVPTIVGGVIVIGAVAFQVTQRSRSFAQPQPAPDQHLGSLRTSAAVHLVAIRCRRPPRMEQMREWPGLFSADRRRHQQAQRCPDV